MHIIYYTWILQHISENIGLFFPKEIIVLIANAMRSIVIKYNDDRIDTDHITMLPMRPDKSYLYYDTDDLLLKTNQFCRSMCRSNDKLDCISFILDNQTECINLRKFMMRIDMLMQSNKQLFGEKYNIYHSCISLGSKRGTDRIKMLLCKEIRLIEIIDDNEEYVPINDFMDIDKIITCDTLVEFVYSLRLLLKPPTYGIYPEIKIIKYVIPEINLQPFYSDDEI